MKRLPLHRRPYLAKTILEVGGGHDPYEGVTHAIDKFPENNSQRAGDLHLGKGVVFKTGDLEDIPFKDEKFDFMYLSHVLEHVNDPMKAVQEINRVALKGYIATPSPLREQISCPYPFDKKNDFHTFFCWSGAEPNTVHVIRKEEERIGEFCDCELGRLGGYLYFLRRKLGYDLEPLMPRSSKETVLYFQAPMQLKIHSDFKSACQSGDCAFASARMIQRWTGFPAFIVAKRFLSLRKILLKHKKTMGTSTAPA